MGSKQKVALLGLGTMGQGMAQNLLKAGFTLRVWNRTQAKGEGLAEKGVRVTATPADAARDADVVIAMLADDDASRRVWLGPYGALAAMAAGAIAVECSTLSPGWVAELHAAVSARGLRMVEAPVTGSRNAAAAGQLNFLVGADEETLMAVSPVLVAMSKEILHLGPVGSGAQLKLINNFLCAVQVTSFAEALAWMERTGLRREAALEFLKRGAPGSMMLNLMAERMPQRNYDVHFLLRLMAKDLRYAQAAAAEAGVELSMCAAARELFAAAQQQGLGDKDMAAVLEAVKTKPAGQAG